MIGELFSNCQGSAGFVITAHDRERLFDVVVKGFAAELRAPFATDEEEEEEEESDDNVKS
jgi:hypothetical protein